MTIYFTIPVWMFWAVPLAIYLMTGVLIFCKHAESKLTAPDIAREHQRSWLGIFVWAAMWPVIMIFGICVHFFIMRGRG